MTTEPSTSEQPKKRSRLRQAPLALGLSVTAAAAVIVPMAVSGQTSAAQPVSAPTITPVNLEQVTRVMLRSAEKAYAKEVAAEKAAAKKAAAKKAAAKRAAASSRSQARVAVSSTGGLSSAACSAASGGSGVESGIGANATKVHRAVCARFPQITTYGGYRADSVNHANGKALDIMVSDSALREEIADWLRANAKELGITEVIRSQHIWTTQRASEGWRLMADRGSITANHYDHVHVSVS